MTKLPRFTPEELVRILLKHGFELVRSKGSHRIYKNRTTGKMTVVPMHREQLPIGTLSAILKQAGIDRDNL